VRRRVEGGPRRMRRRVGRERRVFWVGVVDIFFGSIPRVVFGIVRFDI